MRDGFLQLSQQALFFQSDPQVVAKGDLLGFWPVLGRGHLEKFQARVKTRKHNLPELGAVFGGKYVRPKIFSPKLCNFVYITFWPGREIAKYRFSRPFWPRAALGT